MKRRSCFLPVSLCILFFFVLSACQTEPEENQEQATIQIWVTQHYGQKIVEEKEVAYQPKRSVMDYMQTHFDIDTAYGGGFINAIDGMASGYTNKQGQNRVKKDWFYWVNGISSPIGANVYEPMPGDVIWWDYHTWEHAISVPAVVGAFPHPFVNGFDNVDQGTTIWYTEKGSEGAERWEEELTTHSVSSMERVPYRGQDLFERETMTVLVGTWEELSQHSQIQRWLTRSDRNGLFARIDAGRIQALKMDGTVSKTWKEPALLVTATAMHPGDTEPLWLVVGTDQTILESGLKRWFRDPSVIKQNMGVVISDEAVHALPRP